MDPQEYPEPVWIDRPAGLRKLAQELAEYPVVAVDTESNSLYAYFEQVCLIQFSTADNDFLVDPLAISDLSPLGPIFADERIEKVFHAAEYDLISLKRDFQFEFNHIFDTMVAARILGRQAVGLGSLLEAEFNIHLNKRYQRADWGQRPLPRALLDYARLDTRYLVRLRDRLQVELKEMGRWDLAVEDFDRMRLVHANGRSVDSWLDACWRVPGIQELTEPQISVLQQLCLYRDNIARDLNRPPFKVLSNQAMLEIARNLPHSLNTLRQLNEMNERMVQRHGMGLLKAVQRGLNTAPISRPVGQRPDDQFLMRLDALRNWRKRTGQKMGVESDVILPRDVVYAIAQADPKNMAELKQIMDLLPYRLDKFGQEILQVIR